MKKFWINALLLTCTCLFFACKQDPVAPPSGIAGTDFHLWHGGIGPFKYTDHYLSQETGIVLSLYSSPEHLRNFAPNFRGIQPKNTAADFDLPETWEIEYFCEPDYVLGIYAEDDPAKILYFNRIRWEKSLFFDAPRNRMVLTYRHKPDQGLIQSALNDEGRREIGNLETDMTIQFTWGYGDHHLDVTFVVRNKSSQPRDYTFAAQDAAYLWFPNQSQEGLEPFLFKGSERVQTRFENHAGVPDLFSGLYSPNHGVFSGFRSRGIQKSPGVTVRSSVGVSYYYLLVPRSVPIGYQMPLKDKGHDFSNLIKNAMRSDSNLLNRYAAFEMRNVQPDDRCTVSFQLIMGLVREGQTLESRVGELLKPL